MKEIKAMIRPVMFESVYRDLRAKGYHSITVFNGEGIGRHGDPDKLQASLNFPVLHSEVTKIEILIHDEDEKEVMQIIQRAACTNSIGDGIIYSSTVDKVLSIRNGKEGNAIL